MTFELDEIGLLIDKLSNERNELDDNVTTLSSSVTQLNSLSAEVGDIVSNLQMSLQNLETHEETLSMAIRGVNEIASLVRSRPTSVIQVLSRLQGRRETIESVIEDLKNSKEKINIRNAAQDKLIKKLKDEGTSSGDREIGTHPDGLSKIRKAKSKMNKKDEKDNTQLDT